MSTIPIPQIKPAFDAPEVMNGGGGNAFVDSINSVLGVANQVTNTAFDVSVNALRVHQLFGGELFGSDNTQESVQPLDRAVITSADLGDKTPFNVNSIGLILGAVGLFLLFGGK